MIPTRLGARPAVECWSVMQQSASKNPEPRKWRSHACAASTLTGLAGLLAAFETWRSYGPGSGGDWSVSRLAGAGWTALFALTAIALGGIAKSTRVTFVWLKWLGITLGRSVSLPPSILHQERDGLPLPDETQEPLHNQPMQGTEPAGKLLVVREPARRRLGH